MAVESMEAAGLRDIPEAEAEAAKFSVPADIHADDFIFQHHLEAQPEPGGDAARKEVTRYYFMDGHRSAERLDELIRQHHPHAAARRLSLLEFASGYGCVSRHLAKMDDRYDLVACDIHDQAIDFLRGPLSVKAVLSHREPLLFDPGAKFDVVFALSFFSHMPDRTFGAWIEALYSVLADDGLLIFTAHGRTAYEDVKRPMLEPGGYWFLPLSEQKDLPTADYGTMVATPFYIFDKIAQCSGAAIVLFQDAFWWGYQDLFIVRRIQMDFRPQPGRDSVTHGAAELAGLRDANAELLRRHAADQASIQDLEQAMGTIRHSTSWRVTAPLRALRRLVGAGRAGGG